MDDSAHYFWLTPDQLVYLLGCLGAEYVTVSLMKTLAGTKCFKVRLTAVQLNKLFLEGTFTGELDAARVIDKVRDGHWVKEPKGVG